MLGLVLIASLSCRNVPATFYSSYFEGRQMANGQIFRQDSDSAASNDYPLGTRLRVSRGGRSVTVVVRDRMARDGRIDLTTSRFRQLGDLREGRITVTVCR